MGEVTVSSGRGNGRGKQAGKSMKWQRGVVREVQAQGSAVGCGGLQSPLPPASRQQTERPPTNPLMRHKHGCAARLSVPDRCLRTRAARGQ